MKTRAIALAIAVVLTGCPALDALDAKPDGGSRNDSGADAPTDATGQPDGSAVAPDAAQDAGGDAEAGARVVCPVVDASFGDAVAPPDAACVLSDGSTCAPGYNPSYWSYFQLPPPRAPEARCTSAQITKYVSACPIPYPLSPPTQQCQAFVDATENIDCVGCLAAAPVTAPSLGPILYSPFSTSSDVAYNFWGCLELTDPCFDQCAKAMWDGYECGIIACYPDCAGSQPSGCVMTAANGCICSSQQPLADACFSAIQGNGGSGSECLVAPGVLAKFCGGL